MSFDKYIFNEILEGVEDGIVIFNNNGKIEECNEKFKKIMNLSKQEIVGQQIGKVMNIIPHEEPYINEEYLPKYLRMTTTINKLMKNNDTNISILDEIHRDEKERIIQALRKNKGNVAKAAADLDMSRQNLHYRLIKYDLK